MQPGCTRNSGEKDNQDQVKGQVHLQVERYKYDQRHESTQSHHMHTDLKPDGDEKCDQQGKNSAKHERIEHAGDVNAPDQVEAKHKEEESNDDGYVPVLPFLHLDVVDYLLVTKEQDKHKWNKKGADKNDRGDPGLNIKGKVRQVCAGIEQYKESDGRGQQRMKNMGDDFG